MDISKWSVEDFVLDPEFKKWVLHPNGNNNLVWEVYLSKSPEKLEDIKQARQILLNLSSKSFSLSEIDKNKLWEKVDEDINLIEEEIEPGKVIPLNSYISISRKESKKIVQLQFSQFYRVVAILVVCFGFSFMAATLFQEKKDQNDVIAKVYAEHVTHPGVKSNLTLSDGTKVILNSGSKIYYKENFSNDKRELFLEGEAHFDVFRDPGKPFIVHTGNISTTALGTSFNINAYEKETISIYLLSGKVVVTEKKKGSDFAVNLNKGEAVFTNINGKLITKSFNEEKIIAWTKGIIVFDQTPVLDAIQILETWFGVNFEPVHIFHIG